MLSRWTRNTLAAGRIYQLVGFVCGFALIIYGFNLLAVGLPGARQFTSQFLGANLLVGGSAALFLSLYYLFKPAVSSKVVGQPSGLPPDVGVGLVVEEEPPSQYGFYKHIEYVGFFFTALGLFSVADLILQVLIPPLYNQTRWWVEILLATFGILSYAIFGSIGRVGAQEERLYVPTGQPHVSTAVTAAPVSTSSSVPLEPFPETLQVQISEFSKSSSGEYERKLAGNVFDRFRVEREVVVIWRERRQEIGSVYLAGPYELTRKLMEEYVNKGEELRIGYLSISVETLRDLMSLQEHALQPVPTSLNRPI
jgi:hypothetical protein